MPRPQPIQISIPQPCHEDWSKMTPAEQGRFCNACQKCVVDFTTLTDRQLYEYLDKHKGEYICARTRKEQLSRDIPPIYTRPKPNTYKYIIALGATLLAAELPAESLFAKTPYIQEVYQQLNTDTSSKQAYVLSGSVRDISREPLIGAFIHISQNGIENNTLITDEDGKYSVKLKSGTYTIKTMYTGFVSETVVVNLSDKDVTTSVIMFEDSTLSDITFATTGKIVINTKAENTITYPDGTSQILKYQKLPTQKPSFWHKITNWLR